MSTKKSIYDVFKTREDVNTELYLYLHKFVSKFRVDIFFRYFLLLLTRTSGLLLLVITEVFVIVNHLKL